MNGAAGPLSLPQIEAQALAVLERASDAKVIAIQTRTQAAWPDAIKLSGRQFRLRWCASPLMAREALSALEEGADDQSGRGLIPVSYTHLDVYKRQTWRWPTASPATRATPW